MHVYIHTHSYYYLLNISILHGIVTLHLIFVTTEYSHVYLKYFLEQTWKYHIYVLNSQKCLSIVHYFKGYCGLILGEEILSVKIMS